MAREQLNNEIPTIPMETIFKSNQMSYSNGKVRIKCPLPGSNEQVIAVLYEKLDVEKVNRLFALSHPNVLKPTRVILENNKVAGLVFDYKRHGSLGDYLSGDREKQHGQVFTASRILKWFTQLACAISYCKEQSIFHRNINPSQMLLSDDLESIQVSDFSLTTETDDELDDHVTPSYLEYLALEVIESREQSDAGDVYSFGMSLYACVNKERRTPFPTDPRDERTVIASKQEFIEAGNRITFPIDDMFTDKTAQLQALLEKCWAEIPEDRPTMEEVFSEISHI